VGKGRGHGLVCAAHRDCQQVQEVRREPEGCGVDVSLSEGLGDEGGQLGDIQEGGGGHALRGKGEGGS
jgi:hypothetical protein